MYPSICVIDADLEEMRQPSSGSKKPNNRAVESNFLNSNYERIGKIKDPIFCLFFIWTRERRKKWVQSAEKLIRFKTARGGKPGLVASHSYVISSVRSAEAR